MKKVISILVIIFLVLLGLQIFGWVTKINVLTGDNGLLRSSFTRVDNELKK